MKNIIKLIPIVLLIFIFSCEDKNDDRFSSNPTIGWVDFLNESTTTGQTTPNISIPINVNVPVYSNGLNIQYILEAVEGDFTQFVSSSSGTVFADPSDYSRDINIDIDLNNMDEGRGFVTSFDIILTSVIQNGVTIGVDNESITRHRVTIPCSNPLVLPNDYFVGSYALEDVTAVIGPGNGTSNFEAVNVTLTVDPSNPNIRLFYSAILPAFIPTPKLQSIEFSTDNVIKLGAVGSGIGCGGGGGAEYIYTDAGANSTPWDICNDQSIVINYTEDPLGSCGGPYDASFRLTKN